MAQLQHASAKANGEASKKARHSVKTQTTVRGRACKACTSNARTARSTGKGTSQSPLGPKMEAKGKVGKKKTF